MQPKTKIFSIVLSMFTTAVSVNAYEVFQGPTELIQYNPAKAYKGYTLFSPFRGSNTYLIDMHGDVVNMWPYPKGWATPGSEAVEKHARLLEDGTLYRAHVNRAAGDKSPTYMIYDWDGKVIWQYKDPRPEYTGHHDSKIIWNKKLQKRTLMYVATKCISQDRVAKLGIRSAAQGAPGGAGMGAAGGAPGMGAAGAGAPGMGAAGAGAPGMGAAGNQGGQPASLNVYDMGQNAVPLGAGQSAACTHRPDGLVEVDMDGKVIWEWNFADHTVQDVDPNAENYVGAGKTVADYPGRLDVNFGSGRRGDWTHSNSFDYNEELDQVVINNSTDSEFYVIDHGATFIPGDPKKSIELAAGPTGDFIYRWGNPAVYDSGESPSLQNDGQTASNGHQQGFFTHDIQWITNNPDEVKPSGWTIPGAGNFLIFDNGTRRAGGTFSAVIEINPYEGDWRKGVYVPETKAGFTRKGGGMASTGLMQSNQVVWYYQPTLSNAFFGSYISGAQRLPNGNTLVDSGPHGHFFEVTTEGEVVWEYINPVGDQTKGDYAVHTIMTDSAGNGYNSVFRSVRYGLDYPGLKGKDLTPKGKITEIHTKEPAKPLPSGMSSGGPPPRG